jgi:hypothetical protein
VYCSEKSMEILRLGWIDGQTERIKEFLSVV